MAELRLIKKPAVLAKCAISNATLYRLIKDEQFPAPLHISERAVAWREDEVDEWILNLQRTNNI